MTEGKAEGGNKIPIHNDDIYMTEGKAEGGNKIPIHNDDIYMTEGKAEGIPIHNGHIHDRREGGGDTYTQ